MSTTSRDRSWTVWGLIFIAAGYASASHAAEFIPINDQTVLGHASSIFSNSYNITAISGDGTVVAGSSHAVGAIYDCARFDCGSGGFAYSLKDRERVILEGSPRTDTYIGGAPVSVRDLSYDGQQALLLGEYRHYESYLSTPQGENYLRDNIVVGDYLSASSMSSDGGVIVGVHGSSGFVWTEQTGLQPAPVVDPEVNFIPSQVSGDGTTMLLSDSDYFLSIVNPLVLSVLASNEWSQRAAVWHDSGESYQLTPVEGNEHLSVTRLSEDGTAVIGSSYNYLPSTSNQIRLSVPTVWRDGIASELPLPAGFESGSAIGVSGDGGTIVGNAILEVKDYPLFVNVDMQTDLLLDNRAVIWRDGQLHILQDWLSDEWGLAEELEGWTLTSAAAISANGQTIAGAGVNPDGEYASWVVTLPVPEPGACGLLAASLLAFALYRWPRTKAA
ncbi:hypothetical protein [Aeoliella mucimassa]|nr:hypothetical protein [Aeoliella mucimassa]